MCPKSRPCQGAACALALLPISTSALHRQLLRSFRLGSLVLLLVVRMLWVVAEQEGRESEVAATPHLALQPWHTSRCQQPPRLAALGSVLLDKCTMQPRTEGPTKQTINQRGWGPNMVHACLLWIALHVWHSWNGWQAEPGRTRLRTMYRAPSTAAQSAMKMHPSIKMGNMNSACAQTGTCTPS